MAYTPTLEVEAFSLVKVVEKVKDKLPSEDFNYTDLEGADLSGADLRGADLNGSDLKAANLIEADLRGAEGLPKPD
jgi:hypothetical protein